MSSRRVEFEISGDNKAALASLDQFIKRLDAIGKHKAFDRISQHLTRQRRDWVQVRNHIRDATKDYNKLAAAATRWSKSVENIGRTNVKIVNQTKTIGTATQQAATQATRMERAWRATRLVVQSVGKAVGQIAKLTGRGLLAGSGALRGGSTSIAGSIQSVGISTRMSGIAMAQQLGQIMAGPLTGNIMSAVIQGLRGALNISAGVITVALELGTRVASGIAGGIVKAGGLLIGGALQTVLGSLAGVFSLAHGPLGLIVNSLAGALNNVIASVSTVAGEMVTQVGNVLTGLGEMFRGAFQAAVNIASGVLNTLVTVAQGVVERIGGVLGKVGKAVLGVAGTIGGFAMRDIFKAESALTRGFVLLDPSVTPDQRQALREWAFNIRRELGNITAADPGKAIERAISTGFQKDPEGAREFATAALRLVSITGDEDAGVLTRAAAKVWIAFKDELIEQAEGDESGAMRLLMDKLFAVKNFGDLDLGDLAVRIGDVEGIAKALNMSLDEMLQTISRLSLVLGKEQTFTAFGQMMNTFVKMREGGFEELDRVGIQTRTLRPEEQQRLDALEAERESLLGQDDAYKRIGDRLKELRQRRREIKDRDGDTTRIDSEIVRTQREHLEASRKVDNARLRHLDKEIKRIREMGGSLRNVLDIWTEILQKLRSGEITEPMLGKIIPRLRGLRGMLGLDALERVAPETSEEVKSGIENAAGTVDAALGIRAEDFGTKMLKVLAEIKQPFVQFWLTNREAINGFVDHMTGKLREFNAWWKRALEDPGAAEFARNLGDKLSGLFDWMKPEGGVSPAEFWAAMNKGLNKTWEVGSSIVGVIGDIIKGIDNGAKALGGWGKLWDGIKTAASAVADEIKRLSEGDFSTWVDLWDKAKNAADELWFSIKMKGLEVFSLLLNKLDDFGQALEAWADKMLTKLKAVVAGVGAFALGQGMMPLMMPMRGGGGAPGRPGGAAHPMAGPAAFGASMMAGRGGQIPAWMKRLSPQGKMALLGQMTPGTQRTALARQLGIRGSDALAGRSGYARGMFGGAGGGALGRHAGIKPPPGPLGRALGATGRGMGHLGRGMGALGRGAGRFFLPIGMAMAAYDAVNIFGGEAPAEPKSLGSSALQVGGMTATGAALGGPIGAGVGLVAGLGMDWWDRKKRNEAMQRYALAQERHQTLAPLAQGQGYYEPTTGTFTSFQQHRGPNKDLLDEAGGAIAAAQLTALDPEASAGAREVAMAVINQIQEDLKQQIRQRALIADEESARDAARMLLEPVRTEVEGLAAQFPEDATLAGLRDQVKRLADAISTPAGRAAMERELGSVSGQARRAGEAATRAQAGVGRIGPGGTGTGGNMARLTQSPEMQEKIRLLLSQGRQRQSRRPASSRIGVGKNAYNFDEEDLAFLPPRIREQILNHQAAGTLGTNRMQDLLGAGGFVPRYTNEFEDYNPTVPTQRNEPVQDPGGQPKGIPQDSTTSGFGGDGGKWYYDSQGFLHYKQVGADGKPIFDHAFNRLTQNDPFAQGPMRPGQFGFMQGSLGTPIGTQTNLGGGGMQIIGQGANRQYATERSMFGFRTGEIDPETGRRKSATFANPFRGTAADPGTSNAGQAAEGNFREFQEKLRRAAEKLEEQAESADPETAEKLKAAAEKLKTAAEGMKKGMISGINGITGAIQPMQEASKEVVQASKELAETTTAAVAALRAEIEDLKAKIAELEAAATEGNG